MVPFKLLAVLTLLAFGEVNAGPCKPPSYSTSSLAVGETPSLTGSAESRSTFPDYQTQSSSTASESQLSTPENSPTNPTIQTESTIATTPTHDATSTPLQTPIEPSALFCTDQCARDLLASDLGLASSAAHLAKCNTRIRSTSTQDPSTAFVTTIVFSTVTEGEAIPTTTVENVEPVTMRRRTMTSNTLPTYASACYDEEAYLSACSCIGASVSTYIEDADTLTSMATQTSWITVQGDSPPYTPTESVAFPDGTSWTSDYTYYEVTLPTFASVPTAIEFPTASAEPECLVDPSDPLAEFYLLDSSIGYLFNRNGRPGPPEAPTTEAEALAKSDYSTFNPPLYRLEKPSSGPEGIYDLILVDGDAKLYVAVKASSGEVVFTTASTEGSVRDSLITTIARVSCKGYVSIEVDGTSYTWKGTDDGTELTVGTGYDTIVVLPKAARTPLDTITNNRRSYAAAGKAPRCPNAPSEVVAHLKSGARGNNPNGCGPANGVDLVPDWNFGRCCDAHDNCYDDCGQTFEACNNNFHTCMHGKCDDVHHSIWTFWLYPACMGMADFYAWVVGTSSGVSAFNEANKERCECVCPLSSTPKVAGLVQSYCPVDGDQKDCIITGGDDSNNCGGCGNTCPYKTHCETGNCACDENRCGNLCLNFLTHPRNCGGCGIVCPSGYCYMGACWEVPEVIDRCYPTDGVTNGDFSSGLDSWVTTSLSGGATIGVQSGSGMLDMAFGTIMINGFTSWWEVSGSARMSQDVHICAGQAYELDLKILRFGTGLCYVTIKLGDKTFANGAAISPADIFSASWQGYGPYPITFTEGSAPAGNDFYLHTTLTIEVRCSAGGVLFDDISLHAA
ncbi:hypothetical protein B0T10DRAFT_554126 [Thelonectria olida]|uniref:Uncharacterized protein n=1 Tax=Thelonectria olida TaxID=1576542 RepID=A0A9P9AHH9_9HYPO|nr:hypothetical protein B0T10DRAFT_554126 [Thelonectria olida]